ncbi:hypothetical protein [Streptomyces aurantiogriseus]|uniref:hypothetical protein n=1 Tax=Streptomyces aurantiogriseus TaxID=66870 RepID=UPI001674E158|nr:hypothetical protein [Streptomyces aurantiogriseus]
MLLVGWPGSTAIRLAAEAELRRLGWPVVDGPAAADLLVVAGSPESTDAGWLDAVRRQVPSPKALVTLSRIADVEEKLAAGTALLTQGGQEPQTTEEGAAAAEVQPSSPAKDHHSKGRPAREAHHPGTGNDAQHDHQGHHKPSHEHDEHSDHQESSEHEHHNGSADQHESGEEQGPSAHDGHAGHGMGEMTIAGLPMADAPTIVTSCGSISSMSHWVPPSTTGRTA